MCDCEGKTVLRLMIISLWTLLISFLASGASPSHPSGKDGDPPFQKYKKYGFDFPKRFSWEVTVKKVTPYEGVEKERDYQEFAKLMKDEIQKSEKVKQDASDFQERYQLEKQGKIVEKY